MTVMVPTTVPDLYHKQSQKPQKYKQLRHNMHFLYYLDTIKTQCDYKLQILWKGLTPEGEVWTGSESSKRINPFPASPHALGCNATPQVLKKCALHMKGRLVTSSV